MVTRSGERGGRELGNGSAAGAAADREWESPFLYFNGIDGASGRYLLPPRTLRQALELVQEPDGRGPDRRPIAGVDPRNPEESGWGVVLPEGCPPEVREALQPLLRHRAGQAGERYREIPYAPGTSLRAFYQQQGIGPGPVNPAVLPYYLLLVGGPEEVPFPLQHQLGVSFAVGRISFDTAEEYARYAGSVVAAETVAETAGAVGADATGTATGTAAVSSMGTPDDPTGAVRQRRAVVFAPCHDPATEASAEALARPLAQRLDRGCAGWRVERLLGPDATRSRLVDHLGGRATPDFLFTASHGMAFPADDPRQACLQGALLCQDWSGEEERVARDHYVGGEDVAGDARPAGLVSFHFACFGAGTPQRDRFVHRGEGEARILAPRPRVATLARRLLGHPRGGSLAFVGHVDRAWGYSFLWNSASQAEAFVSAFTEMLHGCPVGAAMDFFATRYGELATHLVRALHAERNGEPVPARELVALWTATEDARAYLILGDPAVRVGTGG